MSSESGDCEFFELIEDRFEAEDDFDIWAYLQKLYEFDCNAIGEIDISKILPGAVEIMNLEDYDIGYHSRECEAKKVSLYRYGDKFIEFSFDLSSAGIESDLDILSIRYHYGDCDRTAVERFFTDTIKISDSIKCSAFIEKNNLNDLNSIIDLFNGVHAQNGHSKFRSYTKMRYNKRHAIE
jgi:hypothetical protein